MKTKRVKSVYRPVCERVKDHKQVDVLRAEEVTERQASRCMDCGTPFCHWACPVGNYIPEWNDFIFHNNWEKAFELLDATNNLPEITGRLCPSLCEHSCVLGINDDAVTIRENELDAIEKAFKEGYIRPRPPRMRTGKRVAVIGSGPSGLAVSAQLNRAGHTVDVFEKDNKAGGLLRYGIPDFKLEKHIVDRRIKLMKDEGINFRTGVNVGVDIDAGNILKEYD
ncbi:MAG: NAD(P)-binding protein, partial [Candidatus Omnitrophota bacterium]